MNKEPNVDTLGQSRYATLDHLWISIISLHSLTLLQPTTSTPLHIYPVAVFPSLLPRNPIYALVDDYFNV
jgi:hypothetical protein